MRHVTVQLERASKQARPRQPGRASDAPTLVLRSPFAAGAVAAVWASAIGLACVALPVLLAWALAPHSASRGITGVPASDAARGGVLAWLAAQHASLHTSVGSLSLVPLGLLAIPALALYVSGRWAGRASVDAVPAAAAATASLAAAYALVVGVVCSLASDASLGAPMAPAVLGAALLAVFAGGLGVVSGGRLWPVLAARANESVPAVAKGALAGLSTMVAGGALLLALALIAHFGQVLDLARSLHAGAFGGLVLLLLGVLCVPTGAVWAASYAVGPGFAVGVGTSVAPAGVALGPVPAFPLLGVLPRTGPAPAASLAAMALPVLAGLVIGAMAARRPAATRGRTVAEAAAAGVAAGVALGLLAWLSAGSLGAVRMSELGPDGLRVGAVAALELAVVAAAVAWEADRHAAVFARAGQSLRRLASRADIVRHRGRPLSPGRPRFGGRKQPGGPA
jgi:Family of unknown function (DUF6350)